MGAPCPNRVLGQIPAAGRLAGGLLKATGAQVRTPLSRRVIPFALFASLGACPAQAQTSDADEADATSARCRHIRSQAESQAYLLFSPRVTVEGGHVPAGGTTGGMGLPSGASSGSYQVRAGLSWSPLDFVHGFMALDASDTECQQLAALQRARRTMELGAEIGELPARRGERESLLGARPQWEALVARAEQRVAQGLASEPQLTALRTEVERLERRISQLDAEIARLVGAGHDEIDPATLRADLDTYERRALDLEHQQSSIRRLAPWNINLLGSVVPVLGETSGAGVDWFGWVTVSYNLGGIAQQFAEDRTLDARAAELGNDATELRHAFDHFERVLSESLNGLSEDLDHVTRLIEIQSHQRELLGQLETSEVENVRAMIDLQVIALEAERAHLSRLLEVRSALRGQGAHDVAGE